MDSEQVTIAQSTVDAVNKAIDNKKNVVAIGTTVMKAIETSVTISKHLKPFQGWTNKFIFPPYEFNVATAMVTNFHLPKSPMMMITAAYCGHDLLKKAYKVAIKEKYNFFTYGDAMLIK